MALRLAAHLGRAGLGPKFKACVRSVKGFFLHESAIDKALSKVLYPIQSLAVY